MASASTEGFIPVKPFLKMMHKKDRKQFAEANQTKDMDYLKHVLWSDEIKIKYLVQMVSIVCGSSQGGVQTQVCLAYSQAWWWE